MKTCFFNRYWQIHILFLALVIAGQPAFAKKWAQADLSPVKTWGYWLQNADIQTLVDSTYDLVVIDYSFDGTDETAYSSEDIQRVKDSGKKVLAYLSIGEAEEYRFYWNEKWNIRKPDFIGPENPDWSGNYKVKYWSGYWKRKCLIPYLDRIIAAGFDGVYLDMIDAYYFWHEQTGKNAKNYANRMVNLVCSIARYSRKKAGDNFIICPQNGSSILEDASASRRDKYLKYIDCIGIENLFYDIYDEQDQQYRLEMLEQFSQAGKLILNVEYIDKDLSNEYLDILNNQSLIIIGYRAEDDAELDELTDPIYPANTVSRNIIYAGARVSSYGIDSFPEATDWQTALDAMSNNFTGSSACAIWIVGELQNRRTCHLFFPADGKSWSHISFEDMDIYEDYLSFFDQADIKIFLQVEPADADINTLIDLVLNRYGHHPCVAGFGIDVEWYKAADHPGAGKKVSDAKAKKWEARVKSHNPDYRLFLKHWDPKWMPTNYRGEIIFVDDSQQFDTLESMVDESALWAQQYYPNTVFFQYGYEEDYNWWQNLDNPPQAIGQAIAERVWQSCGLFWVDFTLEDVLPVE